MSDIRILKAKGITTGMVDEVTKVLSVLKLKLITVLISPRILWESKWASHLNPV